MRKKGVKWIGWVAALVGLVGLVCLSGCAGGADAAYVDTLRGIMDQIDENHAQALEVDFDDLAQAEAYVAETKPIYQSLIDLSAPDHLQEGQDKIKQGAQDMITYLDEVPAFRQMEAGSAEFNSKQSELLTMYSQALSKINEGYSDQIKLTSADTPSQAVSEDPDPAGE